MTSWLILAVLVACGVYLSMRLIAAAYRVMDLWYTIRTAYPAVMRGIAAWGGAAGVLAILLHGSHRAALLAGMLGFVVFYLSLYVLRYLVVRRPAPLE